MSGGSRVIGRYRVYEEIAAGGMATVSFGRLLGPVGFSRTVAVKQLHAQFAKDPEFVSMFLDEARLAARIHHPNVVATLDVVAAKGELVLVMDYVHGESLARLLRRTTGAPIPSKITAGVISGALHGLHAAHEARSETGQPLGIVHRDISPQNVIVGVDGVPRVLDFGVAKAANRLQTTQEGHLKGKVRYMSPEQLQGFEVNRLTDIYAMGVVLHEMVTGRALFARGEPGAVVHEILSGVIPPPSSINHDVPPALDAIIMRALARDPNARFRDAREMALQLEEQIGLATSSQLSAWVQSLAHDTLESRAATVASIESSSSNEIERPRTPPTEIVPQARTSNPVLPTYAEPNVPTGKTAFTVGAPPPRQSNAATFILAGVFALFGLAGVGLLLAVRFRQPAPVVVVGASSAPPPALSIVPVAVPAPVVSVAAPALDPQPVAAVSAAPPKPVPAPAPPPPPRPAAAPRPAPADDMARSRR